MSTKVFNTRLQLKYAPYSEWSAEANQFKLLAGEIAIVNVPAETGAVVSEPSILFKVGDGEKTFNQLPWASGLAADVYGWAKAENKPAYIASEITVTDEKGYFGNTSVEGVLKEIWETVSEMTGGAGSAGSIASQIANGIAALGSVSATEGKYVSGVKVVDGKLAIEEKDLPDYSNTYASKTLEKTVSDHLTAVAEYDSRITAAQNKANEAAQAAADANANAETRVKTADFDTFKTDNTKAIEEATSAGTTAAAGVQDNLDAYEEANNAALAAVEATANAAAKKSDVDSAFEAVNADIEALEDEAATHAKQADLEAEAATARAAEKANADAIAVLNGNDATDGSVDKKIKDAFNKFATDVSDDNVVNSYKELIDYAAEHGAEFTELVGEVDANTKAIETLNGDSTVAGSVDKKIVDAIAGENLAQYETKDDASAKLTEAKGYTDTEIGKEVTARNAAIEAAEGRAAADAKNKADAAQAAAKDYTDAEIGEVNTEVAKKANDADLHTVAKSGKIEDLDQEVEYIIFNCGTATTLVSEPVTE